ncbi:MAG TPA: phosphoenolpyruvate--protein phosphotransferase, partial [Gemmatimonadaceae bacterium]|nr:phosphoenolpyruvate--protein phosphotransferase [Gemmatimonadaceae bacterium]
MPASPGIVDGPVHLLRWEVPDVRHRIIPDEAIPGEIKRFHAALQQAREKLHQVRARAEKHAGPEEAAIFDVQLSILEDGELLRQVEELIHQNLAAEKGFDLVLFEWRQQFASHARPLLRERVGDLIDVHIRVLSILLGLPDHDPVDVPKGSNKILVTHDLTPSLTVQLDREAIIGIATDAGTRTSHVAILARSLGLPAVVGLRDATERLNGNEHVILDGTAGVLIINPTQAQQDKYRVQRTREALETEELQALAVADSVTLDGHWVTLRANVDLPEEAEAAAHSGAEGVGLMRTEFLVVGRATMPDEEEQYRAYRHVVEAFGGRPVVIRTFDVGGDKLPIGGYPTDANPFLGWRAIRMCLDEPELFKTQLRALLRAAMHGDVRIMFPLIITLDEVKQAKQLLKEAAAELDARGVEYRHDIPLGVMVETPAAALSVHTLVDDVSFFSIGTNDLVQYTLAVDRGSATLAARFTPLHPAVLTLIKRIVDVGCAHRMEVAVCGEMASQPLMAFALIGLGVRSLSVAGRAVPLVKRIVRGVSVSVAAEAANAALQSRTAREAEGELRRRLMSAFGDASFLRDGLPGFVDGNIFEGSGGL